MNFWESLAQPWQAALEQAWTAYLHGSLRIGAVIVRGDEIVARGRNRIVEAHEVSGFIGGTQISHAELNALVQLPNDAPTRDLELYTTMEPCPMCTGAIAMASLKTVHFAVRDVWAGSTHLFEKDGYLSGKRIKLHPPSNTTLELICSAICLYSDFEWRGDVPNSVVRAFEATQPAAVQLARDLFQTRQLEQWRKARVEVAEVVDGLAQRVGSRA
jgi:tRNA(adenine34) deaminase